MLINLRNALMAGKRTPTAKDYVQDGLVALFDLKENAGWGVFDGTATRWMNLVTETLASGSGVSFTNDGATVQATTSLSILPFSLFHHTVEARISRFAGTQQNHGITVTQYMTVDGGSNLDRGFHTQRYPIRTRQYINEILGSYICDADISPEDKHTLAASFEYDGEGASVVKFYVDGELKQTSTYQGVLVQGSQTVYSGMRANNYIDRISIYNRAITAQEIAANYAIDKARFGLP